MAKIMVVEDETLIRQWLVMCLQSAGLSDSEIVQACNGEEALLLLDNGIYDIIFTDISMPNLDGIALIKAIRKKDSETKIIILTCHDKFAFAQAAVKYNVSEYLLKNEISKEDIVRIVNSTINNMLDKREHNRIRESFLRGLLRQYQNTPVTAAVLEEHHISITEGRYLSIAFRPKAFDINKIISLQIDGLENITEFYDGIHLHILVANLTGDADKDHEAIDSIKNFISHLCGETLFYGQSRVCNDVSQFAFVMQEAVISWEQNFFNCDVGGISGAGDMHYKSVKNAINEKKAAILSYYTSNGKDLSEKLTLELCACFAAESLWDSGYLKRTICDILEGIEAKLDIGSVNLKEYIGAILSASSLLEIEDSIAVFFSQIPDVDNFTDCIRDAKEYIAMHYSEPLTLPDLAGRAYLSEEYFSRLFKKEIGKNFSEYLTEIRMHRASKLLQNNDFNINEVAEMVGFQNPSYFSNQFKRFYGITPKAMREAECQRYKN